jgi:hypothetical protein
MTCVWMARLIACLGLPASASLVVADFEAVTDNAALLNTGGGSGFSGNWGPSSTVGANTSRIKYDVDANLSYSGGGYAITQTGTGNAYGDFNAFRGINRTLNPDLTGEVWFSLLVRTVTANGHAGLQLNNHADSPFTGQDYNRGAFDVGIRADQLEVRYGSVTSGNLLPLSAGETHLLLGRLVFEDNGVNDRLDVWADPADLSSLGLPAFSANSANLGAQLFLAGVFAYGSLDQTNAYNAAVDALRISDGGGNPVTAYFEVTGVMVPEPSTLALLLAALPFLRRRSAGPAQ